MEVKTTVQMFLDSDERAVSPVISVILMVAITVILAAVIATFVLGLGESTTSEAPSVTFQFEYQQDSGDVRVSHAAGETVDGNQLRFAGAALEKTEFGNITEWSGNDVKSGDRATVSVQGGETLQIVWQNADKTSTAVLGTYEVPATTPATNAVISNLNGTIAAGNYAASPSENGVLKFEIDSVQPSPAQVYIEITDDDPTGFGSDTLVDSIRISGGSTGTLSYEMCADITTDQDTITVTIYSQEGGTVLDEKTVNADPNGTPYGLGDTTGCSEHPG
jgi:flagellin-like protein